MANATYWGPPDAVVDFCESNYIHSSTIAETWNTLSSLTYVVLGFEGCYHAMVLGSWWPFPLTFFMLAVVGCGSIALHGTLRWWGQMLDEMPMLALVVVTCIATKGKAPLFSGVVGRIFYTLLGIAWPAIVYAYLRLKMYKIFVDSFTILVTVTMLGATYARPRHPQTRRYMNIASASIIFGTICWRAEYYFCDISQPLIAPLHVIWHVTSATCCYWWVLYLMCLHVEKFGNEDVWPDRPGSKGTKADQWGSFAFQPFDRLDVPPLFSSETDGKKID